MTINPKELHETLNSYDHLSWEDKQLQMILDLCEARKDAAIARSDRDVARSELRELKHKLEGRP